VGLSEVSGKIGTRRRGKARRGDGVRHGRSEKEGGKEKGKAGVGSGVRRKEIDVFKGSD